MPPRRILTDDEVEFLKNNYAKMTVRQLTGALRMSWKSIRAQAYRRGISRFPPPEVSPVVALLAAARVADGGWTRARVAMALGVSKNMVSLFERGDRYPRFDVLERWAALFGMKVSLSLASLDKMRHDETDSRPAVASGRV